MPLCQLVFGSLRPFESVVHHRITADKIDPIGHCPRLFELFDSAFGHEFEAGEKCV